MELNGKTVPAMVYIMNDGHPFGAPSDYYLNTITGPHLHFEVRSNGEMKNPRNYLP